MREILFRGKPKTDYWFFSQIWADSCKDGFVYGSLLVSKDKYYICVSAICAINQCVNNGTTSMIEVDPSTVGQYTGLTDKNGNRIFEGDVIRFSLKTITTDYVVEWHNGGFVFRDVKIRAIGSDLVQSDADNAEIVGNIHDRR